MSERTFRLVAASYFLGLFLVYAYYMKKADRRYNNNMNGIENLRDALLEPSVVIIDQTDQAAIDG